MQDLDNDNQKFYKEKILNSLGYIVLENRKKTGKGINKFSFEYDIWNGLLSKLEKGYIDARLTTVWKLANAFGMKCSDFIKLIEDRLDNDFNFYN